MAYPTASPWGNHELRYLFMVTPQTARCKPCHPTFERIIRMKVCDITKVLAEIAPVDLAAGWDNVGLLVGDESQTVGKLMLCIDLTEQVLAEAIREKARMIMAYHPVIFKPVSRITATSCPVIYTAAKNGIAVYSMHTALDVAPGGTNDVLADVLGLANSRPIETAEPSQHDKKLVLFAPPADLPGICDAAFAAGAGRIGLYDQCSFSSGGTGTFMPKPTANPSIGSKGIRNEVEEIRLEIPCPASNLAEVIRAIRLAHSYE
ncbi:MAG TPA: Nif3-like dinuclear metal center hexameric protein, partial [Phycisphaerae bacterium]|nr:Nif3-like dinuclear metal center hexameric protein [Phycisphaerae bacterium]